MTKDQIIEAMTRAILDAKLQGVVINSDGFRLTAIAGQKYELQADALCTCAIGAFMIGKKASPLYFNSKGKPGVERDCARELGRSVTYVWGIVQFYDNGDIPGKKSYLKLTPEELQECKEIGLALRRFKR